MPSSLDYKKILYTYIYTDTNPITLPCSLARAGNKNKTTPWVGGGGAHLAESRLEYPTSTKNVL